MEFTKLAERVLVEKVDWLDKFIIVEQLTDGDMRREQQCWEDTDLELLRERGIHTGLVDYIGEVEQRLPALIQ